MISCIVVDDDKGINTVFSEILTMIGLEVVGNGSNGKDAISLYKEHRPDIVFTDIMMPGYDGIFGIKGIKEINPDAKIIAVTGDITLETENTLALLGVSATIYKPFDIKDIKQTLYEKCKVKV